MGRGALIGVAVLAAALLPAWAVNSASQQSRTAWVVAVLTLAFISVSGAIYSASWKAWNPEPYVRRYGPYFSSFVGLSFLVAEFYTIAVTYAEPGIGIVGRSGIRLAELGEALFPVVGEYATALEPPLPLASLFKVQSIVTANLLAGLAITVAYAAYYFGMPDRERRYLLQQNRQKRPSFTVAIFCGLFAFLTFTTGFFGSGEFKLSEPKFCLMEAPCYAFGDDLVVFTAALSKMVLVFLFPVGAVLIFEAHRLLPNAP